MVYELAEVLGASTNGVLALAQSTLYPMPYNLERKGLVQSELRGSDRGRARKYHRLTDEGRRLLRRREREWAELTRALRRLGLLES